MNTRHEDDYNFLFKRMQSICLNLVLSNFGWGYWRWENAFVVAIHKEFTAKE